MVARALEEEGLVELVGELLHDFDGDFRAGLFRDEPGDLVDGERAREASHDGNERRRNGRDLHGDTLGVAEHDGLSEPGIGDEDGFDGTKTRALAVQWTFLALLRQVFCARSIIEVPFRALKLTEQALQLRLSESC